MSGFAQLGAIIISLPKNRNFNPLLESLSGLPFSEVIILEATTPMDLMCGGILGDHEHHGNRRSMSCSEVAAAISHHRARAIALAKGWNAVLILEDDAVLKDRSELFAILNRIHEMNHAPVLLHLFPEQYGIMKNRGNHNFFYDVIKIPDYAVSYILNEKALVEIIKFAPTVNRDLADWPADINRLQVLASKTSVFIHPVNGENQRTSSIWLSRTKVLAGRKGINRFRLIELYRVMIYKFVALFSRKYGTNKIISENLRSLILK
jgi:GR25 family glycosyltransferase involved in LPS biosynthesis